MAQGARLPQSLSRGSHRMGEGFQGAPETPWARLGAECLGSLVFPVPFCCWGAKGRAAAWHSTTVRAPRIENRTENVLISHKWCRGERKSHAGCAGKDSGTDSGCCRLGPTAGATGQHPTFPLWCLGEWKAAESPLQNWWVKLLKVEGGCRYLLFYGFSVCCQCEHSRWGAASPGCRVLRGSGTDSREGKEAASLLPFQLLCRDCSEAGL